jgi:hypothetical protein
MMAPTNDDSEIGSDPRRPDNKPTEAGSDKGDEPEEGDNEPDAAGVCYPAYANCARRALGWVG